MGARTTETPCEVTNAQQEQQEQQDMTGVECPQSALHEKFFCVREEVQPWKDKRVAHKLVTVTLIPIVQHYLFV